jgi:pilus assembly protein CpaB
MKPKTLVLMVVAIACGLVASYMTSRVIADKSEKPTEEKVAVLVARQNLTMGTLIKDPEKLFEEKQFTKGEEPKKAIRTFEDLKDKRLNKPLSSEQFVTPDDLQTKEAEGLAGVMQKGKRGFSLKVDAAAQVGGFVLPHSRVDIVSVIRRNDVETYSKIILQNVLVLAVDQGSTRDNEKQAVIGSTVTVQVTPQESEKLTLAQELGSLKLILRAYGDDEIVTTSGATPKGVTTGSTGQSDDTNTSVDDGSRRGSHLGGILGKIPDVPKDPKAVATQVVDAKPVEPPPPPPKTHTLTIYNGDQMSKAIFTLHDKDGAAETKIDKTGAQAPAVQKPAKSAPTK